MFQIMSGLTREIVTLQVGHYANFVGTHWWNIQVNTTCTAELEKNHIPVRMDPELNLNFAIENCQEPDANSSRLH